MNLLLVWFTTALSVMLGAYLLSGVSISSFGSALMVAVFIGLVNITIKPLILLITLPINILTLGLFTFVINALLLMLISRLVEGFGISGFWPAFFLAVVLGIVSTLVNSA